MRTNYKQIMSTVILASMVATSTLFSCLSELETGHNDHAVGRVGEVSRYQIRPEVWRDFTTQPIHDAKVAYFAGLIASRIQSRRVSMFMEIRRRKPTTREWYILWNAPAQAYRGRPSKAVAARAVRFENLVAAQLPLEPGRGT